MADPYADIAAVTLADQQRMAARLNLRAADPAQRTMLDAYLVDVPLAGARVLDAGCGTGAVTRVLAERAASVIGIDPSPMFVDLARQAGPASVTYQVGDARTLEFPDASFDVVVLHTVLAHVPDPARAIAEAHRVLRPGGTITVFDSDYHTATIGSGPNDPLQACASEWGISPANPWIVRRLPGLLSRAGFVSQQRHCHAYSGSADYLLTIVDRGADSLAGDGRISTDLADALKAEARRRVAAGTFSGQVTYVSVVATRC